MSVGLVKQKELCGKNTYSWIYRRQKISLTYKWRSLSAIKIVIDRDWSWHGRMTFRNWIDFFLLLGNFWWNFDWFLDKRTLLGRKREFCEIGGDWIKCENQDFQSQAWLQEKKNRGKSNEKGKIICFSYWKLEENRKRLKKRPKQSQVRKKSSEKETK